MGNSFFSTFIPLSLLDDDDGSLDYRLEIYDTIDWYWEGTTGISHYYAANYDGSSTPVPEPATIILIGSGLLGLVGVSSKKLKNR